MANNYEEKCVAGEKVDLEHYTYRVYGARSGNKNAEELQSILDNGCLLTVWKRKKEEGGQYGKV
jgi:hypothetical protein